jgi:hypothetical protein
LFFGPADPLIASAQAAGGSAEDEYAQPAAAEGNGMPELFADGADIAQVMMFGQQSADSRFLFVRASQLNLDLCQTERAVAFVGAKMFGHNPQHEELRATCPALTV